MAARGRAFDLGDGESSCRTSRSHISGRIPPRSGSSGSFALSTDERFRRSIGKSTTFSACGILPRRRSAGALSIWPSENRFPDATGTTSPSFCSPSVRVRSRTSIGLEKEIVFSFDRFAASVFPRTFSIHGPPALRPGIHRASPCLPCRERPRDRCRFQSRFGDPIRVLRHTAVYRDHRGGRSAGRPVIAAGESSFRPTRGLHALQ